MNELLLTAGCALLTPMLQYALAAGDKVGPTDPVRLGSDITNTTLISSTSAPVKTTPLKLVKVILPSSPKNSGAVVVGNTHKSAKASAPAQMATNSTTTVATPEQSTDPTEAGLSPVLFLFCVFLMIVAVMLVAKIVLNSKKKHFHTFGGGGFWTSRSSTQSGGRLSLGGGPALGMPTGGISLGGGSAVYTAMPTHGFAAGHAGSAVSEGGIRDPRLDWERHFFEHTDDDDEEHLTTNMEVDPASGSKLQLNANK